MTSIIGTVAQGYLGLKEWPGAKHNPAVVALFVKAGHPEIKDDETPWCAAFVGAVLAEAGVKGTGALNARSYMKWGDPVDIADARDGDVVVFWRGTRDGWQGHVGFFSGFKAGSIIVIGAQCLDGGEIDRAFVEHQPFLTWITGWQGWNARHQSPLPDTARQKPEQAGCDEFDLQGLDPSMSWSRTIPRCTAVPRPVTGPD